MVLVVPKGRNKHLTADALFGVVRRGFATIPDDRRSDTDLSFTDALRSAFALFSLTSPSLLALDKERPEGNWGTLYGMQHVPCNTHMRERLDPVLPASLRPSCPRVLRHLQRSQALEELICLDGHSFLALDGPGDVSSKTMHGASCLSKVHRNGSLRRFTEKILLC